MAAARPAPHGDHISGGKAGVAGTYNHAPEKRATLERWASYVESVSYQATAECGESFALEQEEEVMGGWHRSASERHLTPEQIVDTAVKIIGKDRARHEDVQAIVDHMSKLCERSERTQSRESKNQKQFAKQYGAALRKVMAMTRNAPTDFRVLPRLQICAPQLGIDKEEFDHGHLLRHLTLLNAICESWEKSKLGKPKPDAYEKRLAAEAALQLLKAHDINPTTTKAGAFCKLAAVLYGDKSAALQHHCRAALGRAQIRAKNNPG